MPKFYIVDEVPVFVGYVYQVEAETAESALQTYVDDDSTAEYVGHALGEGLDGALAKPSVREEPPEDLFPLLGPGRD